MEVVKKPIVKPPTPTTSPKNPSPPPVTKGQYRIVEDGLVECSNGHKHGSIVAALSCGVD